MCIYRYITSVCNFNVVITEKKNSLVNVQYFLQFKILLAQLNKLSYISIRQLIVQPFQQVPPSASFSRDYFWKCMKS